MGLKDLMGQKAQTTVRMMESKAKDWSEDGGSNYFCPWISQERATREIPVFGEPRSSLTPSEEADVSKVMGEMCKKLACEGGHGLAKGATASHAQPCIEPAEEPTSSASPWLWLFPRISASITTYSQEVLKTLVIFIPTSPLVHYQNNHFVRVCKNCTHTT